MEKVDVLVLGAGAAGLMAAGESARRGRSVLVIDHASRPGEKIRISGGGRCNFTNLSIAPERFLSENPRFALSALRRFTPADFLARVEAAGIAWHEKTLGQLFCDGKATQIVAMLCDGLERAGGQIWLGCALGAIRQQGGTAGPGRFIIDTDRGPVACESLVVATGGKSIPKMGATGLGYRIAEHFGLPVTETRPGLVPLTFAEQELTHLAPLAGVALPARVGAGKTRFDEALLFTHRGLSGPAILQISNYWREGQEISLDLLPGQDLPGLLAAARQASGRQALGTALARLMPERLAERLAAQAGLDPKARLADLGKTALAALQGACQAWRLRPVGTEGYRTAEVTLGGVSTAALDGRSLQARGVEGLFFVGEVVDVTGWLGGYNFQWAWSSGWAAGQVA